MSVHIDGWLNETSFDSRTKNALRKIFDQIYTDAAANKSAFDDHTHRCNGGESGSYTCTGPGSDTTDVGEDQTAETFANNLDT